VRVVGSTRPGAQKQGVTRVGYDAAWRSTTCSRWVASPSGNSASIA
jgi:hypothetical protein